MGEAKAALEHLRCTLSLSLVERFFNFDWILESLEITWLYDLISVTVFLLLLILWMIICYAVIVCIRLNLIFY